MIINTTDNQNIKKIKICFKLAQNKEREKRIN